MLITAAFNLRSHPAKIKVKLQANFHFVALVDGFYQLLSSGEMEGAQIYLI